MKHPIRVIALLVITVALLILVPAGTYALAQTGTRTPTPMAASQTPRPSQSATPAATPTSLTFATPVPVQTDILIAQDFTLAGLGVRNLELVSPQGSAQFSFEIPDNWLASGNNAFTVNVEFFQSGGGSDSGTLVSPPVSTLEVRLGSQLIGSAAFREEDSDKSHTLTFQLPSAVMTSPTPRRKIISFALDARDHCESNLQARVFIRSDLSFLHFEYQRQAPSLNLRQFPRPFFNSPLGDQTESVMFVLPDSFSPTELEAAMSLSAGFGRLTGDQLEIKIARESELSAEDRRRNNLILIGTPERHKLIRSLYGAGRLNTKWAGAGQFSVGSQQIAPDEGVVELIAHPEDSMMAIMVITGASEEAILKGARAFAGPVSAVGLEGPLALISRVPPPATLPAGQVPQEARTFEQIGYEQTTLFGVGRQFADFRFTVPANARLKQEAYVELVFDYSDTLRTANTSVNLLVNEQPIGSVEIDPARLASEGPIRLRAPIPPSFVRAGEANSLAVVSGTSGNWGCRLPSPDTAWLSIRPESMLSLPNTTVDSTAKPLVSNFPLPFNTFPDLHDVLLVLPDQPSPLDMQRALLIMSRIGSETTDGAYFRARAAFGPMPGGLDLSQFNLLVLGRPTNNSVLAGLNDKLPQPFVKDTEDLIQLADDVTIRLPPGFDVGVMQTLKSPWSAARTVLVVTGTSNIGEGYAANAILGQTFARTDQISNVVFVTSNSIYPIETPEWLDISTDLPSLATQSALVGTPQPTQPPSNTVTPGPTPTSTITNTPRPTNTPTLIFTETPNLITPSPSPLPTLPALRPEDLLPEEPDQPRWLFLLAVITGIVAAVSTVAGVWSTLALLRRRRKLK